MAGRFVVEAEALGGVGADLGEAAGVFVPAQRWRLGVAVLAGPVHRRQRVVREAELEVGDQQLLVLLLVLDAQRHQVYHLVGHLRAVEQRLHRLVHAGPPGAHRLVARPRQQMPLRARVLFADAVVIAVEQIFEALVGGFVAGRERLEDKGLEKPGGMGQVPARRADFRTGLQAHVLGGERLAQGLAERAGVGQAPGQAGMPWLRFWLAHRGFPLALH